MQDADQAQGVLTGWARKPMSRGVRTIKVRFGKASAKISKLRREVSRAGMFFHSDRKTGA